MFERPEQHADRPKVICIGWHKTGTSTLGRALVQLGYSVLGCRLDMVHPLRRDDIDAVMEVAREFDALQDVPWAALFRELDQSFPGSRFILTERDEDSWLTSASRHFADTYVPLHEWLYGKGVLRGNEDLYLARYREHNQQVKSYFESRPEDLLVLRLGDGDEWHRICHFLGHQVPNGRFPHENKGPQNYNAQDRVKAFLRSSVPLSVRQWLFSVKLALRRAVGLPDPRNIFNNREQNEREIQLAREANAKANPDD
ncbi:MAG: sulfotransferase family protein [Wenzhouxiangella sp.]